MQTHTYTCAHVCMYTSHKPPLHPFHMYVLPHTHTCSVYCITHCMKDHQGVVLPCTEEQWNLGEHTHTKSLLMSAFHPAAHWYAVPHTHTGMSRTHAMRFVLKHSYHLCCGISLTCLPSPLPSPSHTTLLPSLLPSHLPHNNGPSREGCLH